MAMQNTTVSFRIPTAKVKALAKLAALQERDRSYLLNEAVDQYLALNEYHIEHIREGLRQAQSGRFVSNEAAQAHMQVLIAKANSK